MGNINIDSQQILDLYLARSVRHHIENKYYLLANKQAKLDELVHDNEFMDHMYNHISLFSDHGVVHVRDVAQLTLSTLDHCLGTHIASRSDYRLHFMKGYGVIMAYLHDIGMIHFSHMGRITHPEFAAQEVFSHHFDRYINTIWLENCGNVPWRLRELHERGLFDAPPKTILRECLALIPAQSKTKCPIKVLNNPVALRKKIIDAIQYDLAYQYHQSMLEWDQEKLSKTKSEFEYIELEKKIHRHKQKLKKLEKNKYSEKTQEITSSLYNNFSQQAFTWLLSKNTAVLDLIDDIIDTLRVLRCADSFRQRGTEMKTSGGYQIFCNLYTGNAVFALSNKAKQIFLLEDSTPHAIGETNIASTEFNDEGDLSISFYTGAFKTNSSYANAVESIALIIYDIVLDVVNSFILPKKYRGKNKIKKTTPIKIVLENVSDNWRFTKDIARELEKYDPSLRRRIAYSTQLSDVHLVEKNRYIKGKLLTWSIPKKREFIKRVKEQGHKTTGINQKKAFNDVRLATLSRGEYLVETGTAPGFVYVPLTTGLLAIPTGGYEAFKVPPYVFIGNRSIISGTHRNATIMADNRVKVLIMPQEIYMNYWHRTYNENELKRILRKVYHLQKK